MQTLTVQDSYIQQMLDKMAVDDHYIYPQHRRLPIKSCEAIYSIIKVSKPQICVETGVSSGVSTTYILSALKENGFGRLISVDCQSKCGWLIPDDLKDIWTFKVGYSKEVLPVITNQIDFFFHDSLHTYTNMMFELEWAWKRLRKEGIMIVDNIGARWGKNNAFWVFAAKHHQEILFISKSTGMFKFKDELVLLGNQEE